MATIDLRAYGVSQSAIDEAKSFGGASIARITSQFKGLYRAVSEKGELNAEISGKMRFEAGQIEQLPAVGDFVLLDRAEDSGGNAIIQRVLARKSAFVRKAAGGGSAGQVVAANIDIVFICMALDHDFNLRRLERYLALAWNSGARPVVVLTKSDVCESIEALRAQAQNAAIGADVITVSALETDGASAVKKYIRAGETAAFIGSSGVGKSTLINKLLGREALLTGGIRADGRGRHTTTNRELMPLPGGGLVMDTPGMRELGMVEDCEGLGLSFADIEEILPRCRFFDCTHTNEPGCAINAALQSGALSPERWESYKKLKAEASFAENKRAYIAEKEEKFKSIMKAYKNSQKER